jgi:hypothetical protein
MILRIVVSKFCCIIREAWKLQDSGCHAAFLFYGVGKVCGCSTHSRQTEYHATILNKYKSDMNQSHPTKRSKGLNAPANSEKPKRPLSRRKYHLSQEDEDLRSRHFYREMMIG